MSRPLSILQVSPSDTGGGAERSALTLCEMYRQMGHESWLAVGAKSDDSAHVFEVPNDGSRNAWVRWWSESLARHDAGAKKVRGAGRAMRALRDLGQLHRVVRGELGIDDFDYPATRDLLQLPPSPPDVVHVHNLHGGYFDLRELATLSHQVPTILSLHDAWLASGHCAFSLDCERWTIGCGQCPDLSLYPAVKRDATAHNHRVKRDIMRKSRLCVTTPSQWLMDRIERSLVAPAIHESRVIPNGIDTTVFSPGDRDAARATLGIPGNARVLLTVARDIATNPWKDFATLRATVAKVTQEALLLVIGDDRPPEQIGRVQVKYIAFEHDPQALVRYYRAADIYVHAAKVESFGNVMLEARACATPVVATSTGGIPEHVRGLAWPGAPQDQHSFEPAEATGVLTPVADSDAMAAAIDLLLRTPDLRAQLGDTGMHDVRSRFSLQLQATRFLDWYRELCPESRKP